MNRYRAKNSCRWFRTPVKSVSVATTRMTTFCLQGTHCTNSFNTSCLNPPLPSNRRKISTKTASCEAYMCMHVSTARNALFFYVCAHVCDRTVGVLQDKTILQPDMLSNPQNGSLATVRAPYRSRPPPWKHLRQDRET